MSYTIEDVKNAVKISINYSEVLRKLDRKSISGSSHKCIQNFIKQNNIDISHFTFHPKQVNTNKKTALEILVLNGTKNRRTSKQLRRALLETGVEYKCKKCGIFEWNKEQLILEINHINGNPLDNRPDNLEFLCPNCHSLTPNFYNTKIYNYCDCGNKKYHKNKFCEKCFRKYSKELGLQHRKVERPNKEELEKIIWLIPTIKIAKQYGVTDKAIDKWCKSYNIQKPPRGYWSKQKMGLSSNGKT